MHIDAETVQRIIDDELDAGVRPDIRRHVDSCAECRSLVETARREQAEIFALLGKVDHDRKAPSPRDLMIPAVRPGTRWIGKAAAVLLAVSVAGAAYAAPGSPLRPLIDGILGREVIGTGAVAGQTVTPAAGAVSGITVDPGQALTISFRQAQRRGAIRISVGAVSEVEVRASAPGASFTSGQSLLTVDNAGYANDFVVVIPQRSPRVEIRVGSSLVFLKDGSRLVTSAPQLNGAYTVPLSGNQ